MHVYVCVSYACAQVHDGRVYMRSSKYPGLDVYYVCVCYVCAQVHDGRAYLVGGFTYDAGDEATLAKYLLAFDGTAWAMVPKIPSAGAAPALAAVIGYGATGASWGGRAFAVGGGEASGSTRRSKDGGGGDEEVNQPVVHVCTHTHNIYDRSDSGPSASVRTHIPMYRRYARPSAPVRAHT